MDEELASFDFCGLGLGKSCKLTPRDISHICLPRSESLEDVYHFGPTIGHGRFGEVFEVTDRASGKKYALKTTNKNAKGSKIGVHVLEREINILALCTHPNIIQLYQTIESSQHTCLVLELCKVSLADILSRNNNLKENVVVCIVKQIISALIYLHENEIAHRDLKIHNILCNPPSFDRRVSADLFGTVKISDFGLAACRGEKGTPNKFSCRCGTPTYMAPEVLEGKDYDQKCDIWSLGIITYFCLIGLLPFSGRREAEVLCKIHCSKVELKGEIWDKFSKPCKSALKRMLRINPENRYSAAEVGKHAWLSTGNVSDVKEAPKELYETKILRVDLPRVSSQLQLKTGSTDPAVYKSLILKNNQQLK